MINKINLPFYLLNCRTELHSFNETNLLVLHNIVHDFDSTFVFSNLWNTMFSTIYKWQIYSLGSFLPPETYFDPEDHRSKSILTYLVNDNWLQMSKICHSRGDTTNWNKSLGCFKFWLLCFFLDNYKKNENFLKRHFLHPHADMTFRPS